MDSENITTEFLITIYTINLKVKFPCKMSLHYDSKPISSDIESKGGVFTFNQDLKIKIRANEQTEINVYLGTGKSGNIIAGTIFLSSSMLESREGQKITIALQKCLDEASLCNLKVNHSWKVKQKPIVNLAKSTVGGFVGKRQRDSPESKKGFKNSSFQNKNETKSELQGYNIKRNTKQSWTPYYKPTHYDKYQKMSYEKDKFKKTFNLPQQLVEEKTEEFYDGKTYDRNRKKKNQSFNETENNLKLDLMKQKSKNQELQRTISQKGKTIKQLRDQIVQFQRKKLEKQYVEEQLAAKENSIKILQDRIANITTENNNFRQAITENQKTISQIKDKVRFDILQNKEDYEKKQHTLKLELNNCKGKINELQMDCSNRSGQIVKAKKYIEDLEAAAEEKIFEHDQLIQNLKKEHHLLTNEYERKILDLEERLKNMNERMEKKNQEIIKLNETLSVKQEQIKSLEVRISGLESEKTELSPFKGDFYSLSKKFTNLQDTYKEEQKQNEKNIQLKNKEISEIQDEHSRSISIWETKMSAIQDKNKQLKQRISELENALVYSKNDEDKLKKQSQKLEKTISAQITKISKFQQELKEAETKIQNLQRTIQEKQNAFAHAQSLYKIEIQHNKESISSLTSENSVFEEKCMKIQSQLDSEKSEKVKLENKVQLLEDASSRAAEYMKDKKGEFQTKQAENRQTIQGYAKRIKQLEDVEKAKQKEINSWEIVDLNNRNKIENLEKHAKELLQKLEKFEKTTVPKLQSEKKSILTELDEYKDKLKDAIDENKYIINERTKLESETNKNTKINSVLNQEKLSIMGELNKAKNTIQRAEKKEETLNNQVKTLNEEIKKIGMKNQMLMKENNRNKEIVSETMNTIINRSMNKEYIQSTRSIAFDLNKSRYTTQPSDGYDIRRMLDLIESSGKEQQNMIIALEDTNKQYKQTISRLETELNSLSMISKQNDEKNAREMNKISEELIEMHQRTNATTQDYEDRISIQQTEISRKEKELKMAIDSINTLKYELDSFRKKFQVTINDNEINEHKMRDEIQELLTELNFNEMNIKSYEEEKKKTEKKIFQLEEDLMVQRDENLKKQKEIADMNEKYTKISKEHSQLTFIKKDNTETLMTLKEEINALKEQNSKVKELLKEEEDNKKKLQQFTNNVIKQKQVIVKSELQASSKVFELEGKLLQLKAQIESLQEQLNNKEQIITTFKSNSKESQQNVKQLEIQYQEEKFKVNQLTSKLQQKQKRIHELEGNKVELTTKYEQLDMRYKKDLTSLKEQYEELAKSSSTTENEKDHKITSLQEIIADHEETIGRQTSQISQYEETIFFERQKVSLSESTINQLKKETSEYSLMINKLEEEVRSSNEETTAKEEKLYEYSGLLYEMEQKLQDKDAQVNKMIEKSENNWKYKLDQLCEEYEQKLQNLEKQKFYFRQKFEESQLEKEKFIGQIRNTEEDFLRELAMAQQKEKEHETEKIFKLGEKHKEIQKLKDDINNLTNSLKTQKMEAKKLQYELTLKEEGIKKLQRKIEENDSVTLQQQKSYEAELNNYKGRQLTFKNYKEQIKESQWVVERQMKKISQNFIQKVVGCFPEGKQKLSEPIRQFQQSMVSVLNFKI